MINSFLELPEHLAGFEAEGLALSEPIAQFEIGDMKNFIYLILDWQNKKAAIVDPQKDLTEPLRALEENGFELTTILLTHSHFDHTAGVAPLLKLFPNLTLRVGHDDIHRLSKTIVAAPRLKILKDGESFQIGHLNLIAIHTPGHSAGAFSYYLAKTEGVPVPYVFTGDTIFVRDCGRTDLESGSNEEMFASVQKIKKLPSETVLLVGHHYAKECATTLARELVESPPFRTSSVKELAELP